ncbi:MAG: PhzF family phenazine biosynthesis protein [Candidatus Gastranaerophilales bacterium]|nr:PhzF family phenazine biosynthesis protein [Candidatus Gastranaerophilales bacterium]
MIKAYSQSAFSKNNQGGNLAGIVFDEFNLSKEEKLKISRYLGYSETVFVSSSKKADYKFKYYTPEAEVPMCGHATIAAFSLMHKLNMLKFSSCNIETGSGILNISIFPDGLIYMQQNRPQYGEILKPDLFENCIDIYLIDNTKPIQIVSTGLRDIILPIKNLDSLNNMTINFNEMINITKKYNTVGIHAFTLLDDKEKVAICRNFAPLYGINEESATGTANCALACYLHRIGIKKKEYIFEQGYNLKSVSEITVKLDYTLDEINFVQVGGYGYTVNSVDIAL